MQKRPSLLPGCLRAGAWLALALLFLLPLLWTVTSSFKTSNVAIFDRPFSPPNRITFLNYAKAVREGHMRSYFINSL